MKHRISIGHLGPAIACAWLALTPPATCRAESPSLATIETLTAQWVAIQAERAAEDRAWEAQRGQLERDLALLETEEKALIETLATLRREQAISGDQRGDQLGEHQAHQATTANLLPALQQTEAALLAIDARLPPALRPTLEATEGLLPTTPALAERLTATRRLQNIATRADALASAARRLHVTRELIADAQGRRRDMDLLFIGFAQGYAVTPDGRAAALGRPGPAGWVWNPTPAADPIANAIRRVRDGNTATLVHLPLQLGEQHLHE